MILIAIGSLTVAASIIVFWRRAVEMRVIRWELYRLRDELRLVAFSDRALLKSDIFRAIDSALTRNCAHLDELSLWSILPVIFWGDRRKIEGQYRDFMTKLNQPQHAALIPIYETSSDLFAKHLAWRHVGVSVLATVTILGIVMCGTAARWLTNRIVSDVMRPALAHPVSYSAA
jgi:hypothetical protein